jgi:integrase
VFPLAIGSLWSKESLLMAANEASIRGKRDYATLAILVGCGLRRGELTALRVEDIQQREEH